MPTRRTFLATAALLTCTTRLRAQTSRINVGDAEREHILSDANTALTRPPASNLAEASHAIAALTAAFVLTHDDRYALQAGKFLYALFVDEKTRLDPTTDIATPPAILDLAPLAEVARALPFLADTAALSPQDTTRTLDWFRAFQSTLNTARNCVIAREAKDHAASAWLLLSAAIARLLHDEPTLTALRIRFKRPTMRNQISATGSFPHEVATPFPLRYTLLNFDLLTAACELLSTPFASLWTYELDDGPGLRAVAAFLYPLLKDPARWPFLADAEHFREVPRRRPGLLLAGRAYDRPEYVELWRSLPPLTADAPALRASIPIRQPLLWTTRPPHSA